ncbi:hypothetical protein DAA51_12720 [Bradyrhizobium sp. WBAH10]|nr:hypothetical protein DAA51_12720 [Bradyrhizobium sp. WBAH10]QCJ81927.1 hypothetical protein DAA53_12735 [Bradyrhizobium sp. WBAH23]QCJ89293.1 hypothetical protein DAA57_12810 [Bradyrhizobium yuanmingense]
MWPVADIVMVGPRVEYAEPSGPARSGPADPPGRSKDTENEVAATGGGRIATMPAAKAASHALVEAAYAGPQGSGFSADIKGLDRALDPEKAPFLLA